MQINSYNQVYAAYFQDNKETLSLLNQARDYINTFKRVFFIGNGGSNSICSHMMEDYAKIGGFQTFTFSDPALITCFANDYGYEKAMEEWLKIYMEPTDLLVAISSSGNSMNINNAVDFANSIEAGVVALSGFKESNKLNGKGTLNFHIPVENYGIVECFHQVILHAILDDIYANK